MSKFYMLYPNFNNISYHMNQKLVFVTNRVCPFAHRVYLTLLEKNVTFQMKEVNLLKKQPQFTQIYKKAFNHEPESDGKVPIIVHGDKYIAGSDIITWYIAELFTTGNQLIPQDHYLKAKVRSFSGIYPEKIYNAFYRFMGFKNKQKQHQEQIIQKCYQAFELLNNQIVGPYAIGDEFTIADILVWPWIDRFSVIQHYFGIKIDTKYTKLWEWINLMKQRQSVKNTTQPRQLFTKGYGSYFG